MKLVNSSRSRSGLAWASCSSISRAASILGVTVIVVSFFESVVRDHSKDHAVTVTRYGATRSPPNPYTTLLDSTFVGVLAWLAWQQTTRIDRASAALVSCVG
jgi:hypothetical protein